MSPASGLIIGALAFGLIAPPPSCAAEPVPQPLDQTVPHTAALPDDPTVWPNRLSCRNSDPWLAENHDRIRTMRPRVIVLNFSNDTDMDAVRSQTARIIGALAESTRHHGFRVSDAPAFLEYEVVRYVDLRDKPGEGLGGDRNSTLFPAKPGRGAPVLCDYAGLYTDAFARHLGFEDPRSPGRLLNLHELIEAGALNELWLFANHHDAWPALEVAELKQHYNDELRAIPGVYGPAGNGHDDTMPWSGRSFRIAFFNPHRGTGCAMENFGHGLESTAESGAIPYLHRYFREFAEFDLDARHGTPFNSLYAVDDGPDQIAYPTGSRMEVRFDGRTHRIEPYVAVGGNVHFPPGARHHYDLDSPYTVQSTIENYRRRKDPASPDTALPFSAAKFRRYDSRAPDCMGAWTVFWRQCMPGLDNRCIDDDGRPMKNWWVFLFY